MARSIEALATPALLGWARRSMRLEIHEAAERADVPRDVLEQWEAGAARPSMAQLRKLADLYKRPLAVFYLPTPPKDFDAMKYLRRVGGTIERAPSPELTYQIREAESRREIAAELASQAGEQVPRFTPRARADDDPSEWAARTRTELGITTEEQFSWKDDYAALGAWRSAIERLGVLVFQVSGVDVEEMRGFSIFAETFPVVAVNGADTPRARSFSLLHEFAHVALGHGDVDSSSRFWFSNDQVELFCNEVAGQVLVPEALLARHTALKRGERASALAPTDLVSLATRFRVSEHVILLRLLKTNRISDALYGSRQAALALRRAKKQDGGGSYYRNLVANLGRPYIRAVLEAFNHERISLGDVSDYLGVKVDNLDRVRQEVRLSYEREAAW